MKIVMTWGVVFLALVFYYTDLQLPLERSFIKGVHLLAAHQNDQARDEFNKITAAYPNYTPAYFNLMHISAQEGRWQQGLDFCRKGLESSIANAEDVFGRNVFFLNKPDFNNQIYTTASAYSRIEMRRYNDLVISGFLLTFLNDHEVN